MKVSEFLRTLADMIDKADTSTKYQSSNVPSQPNTAELYNVQTDNDDNTDPTTMIPPLQQKMELLKKSAGVDSVYDNESCGQCDELDQLKKAAGISTVSTFISGEDNDVFD